jgi:GAF domain-containing protein
MGSAEPAQQPGATPVDGATRARELEIVREIANAFLTATSALEVYRLALIRAMPLVGASFGSIFLRDPVEPELLRLECAHNWPQPSARFLGQMRIRVGRGPTGRAVAEHRPIEADDIFADPALRDWWEPARELAFTAIIALPLIADGEATGAVSFYYRETHRFSDTERHILDLLATQLAVMTRRVHLIDELRETQRRLRRDNHD